MKASSPVYVSPYLQNHRSASWYQMMGTIVYIYLTSCPEFDQFWLACLVAASLFVFGVVSPPTQRPIEISPLIPSSRAIKLQPKSSEAALSNCCDVSNLKVYRMRIAVLSSFVFFNFRKKVYDRKKFCESKFSLNFLRRKKFRINFFLLEKH